MDPIIEQFLALFPRRSDSVVKYGHSGNWRQLSRFHQLSDQEILDSLELDTKLFRGFEFDTKSRFMVLRILNDSCLHNSGSVFLIRELFTKLCLYPKHYLFEDDWYFYISFSEPAEHKMMCRMLAHWCMESSIEVGPTGLEIFPSDSAIPFPLQSGFTWVNDRCHNLVRRDEISFESAVALFLSDLNKNTVSPFALQELIANSLEHELDEQDNDAELDAGEPLPLADRSSKVVMFPLLAVATQSEKVESTIISEESAELFANALYLLPRPEVQSVSDQLMSAPVEMELGAHEEMVAPPLETELSANDDLVLEASAETDSQPLDFAPPETELGTNYLDLELLLEQFELAAAIDTGLDTGEPDAVPEANTDACAEQLEFAPPVEEVGSPMSHVEALLSEADLLVQAEVLAIEPIVEPQSMPETPVRTVRKSKRSKKKNRNKKKATRSVRNVPPIAGEQLFLPFNPPIPGPTPSS